MTPRWSTAVVMLLLLVGCDSVATDTSDQSTTAAPATVSTATTTIASAGTSSTETTARTSTTSREIAFDLVVTVDGVDYALPSAICGADDAAARSVLNHMMSATQREIERLASGWPTTTSTPESSTDDLEKLAIATTAVAIHRDSLGIWEARLRDINESYVDEANDVDSGPIEAGTPDRWRAAAGPLAGAIDGSCS